MTQAYHLQVSVPTHSCHSCLSRGKKLLRHVLIDVVDLRVSSHRFLPFHHDYLPVQMIRIHSFILKVILFGGAKATSKQSCWQTMMIKSAKMRDA